MNLLEKYEATEVARLSEGKVIPDFRAGDTVTVKVTVIEGENKRQQAFQGVVIARHNRSLGIMENFNLISHISATFFNAFMVL